VTASVFGNKNVTAVSRKDEVWLTKKLADSGMQIWTQQRTIKTGSESIDKIIAAETKRFDGIPLKIISVTTSRENSDKAEVTTLITEITSLKKTAIQSSEFEIPAGYKNNNETMESGLDAISKSLNDVTDSSKDGSPAKSLDTFMNGLFGKGK
jgi:hypothetical protein